MPKSTARATVLALIFSAIFSLDVMGQEYTTGDCSPIVKHIGGNVSITCNLHSQIPVYKFQASFTNDGTAQQTMGHLTKFLEQNSKQIFELDIDIDPELKQTCYETYSSEKCNFSNITYSKTKDGSGGNITLLEFSKDGNRYYDGGTQYEIHQKHGAQWIQGSYIIQGYFYIEYARGIYRGWMVSNIYEVDKGQLVSQGRHKLSD